VGHRGAAELHRNLRHQPVPFAADPPAAYIDGRWHLLNATYRHGGTPGWLWRTTWHTYPLTAVRLTLSKSPSSRPWRRNGGTRPASSRRCTSSTRFGSASSATRQFRTSPERPGA